MLVELVELAVAERAISPSRMLLLQCNIHGQDHAQVNMRPVARPRGDVEALTATEAASVCLHDLRFGDSASWTRGLTR